ATATIEPFASWTISRLSSILACSNPAAESKTEPGADLDHPRRLDRGRQARGGAGDRELLDLERHVQQVVGVHDRREAVRADRERFLQPRVERAREREPRAAVAERAHSLGALVESRQD